MKKKLLLILGLLFTVSISFSQNLWTKTSQDKLNDRTRVHRSSHPKEFQLYKLNLEALKSKLVFAPQRGSILAKNSPLKISFPNSEGKMEAFSIIETQAMEDELARKMPMIKSYAGQGIEDPTATIRFTVTQLGLHTMTLSGTKRSWFIEPFTENRENYIVYSKDALGADSQSFECLLEDEVDLPTLSQETSTQRATDDGVLKTYRLAQSCTGEYGAIFGLGTGTIADQKARVQAQMVVTMTRVNGIYERDLAITMIFVADNDKIIYLDAGSDPWTNEWNTKTAQTIDTEIGVANYDIGHNFNTTGGGNAGCLFCVCLSASQSGTHKGRGYTGRADPTGDPFDVDYVAHEMGHQFGGYHTMNSCSRSGGNGSEVEPASGSTIMGYAGICNVNIQSNSDAYFNYVNIRDISGNVQTGGNSDCAVETNLGNATPTADAGDVSYIIPRSTPYALTGISTDADGTASHTFTWEQIDNAQNPQEAPQSNYADGPLTRSIQGTTNPTRYIPNLPDLIAGTTTWEVLSSVDRDINFALTVRDNNAGGGQTADDTVLIQTVNTGASFAVTSQNTTTTWAQGATETVTWTVAGTTANGINAANVDIILFKDNDFDTPIILASGVPNNGSADIIVPNGESPNCRIIVKGSNHVFFNINTANIEIAGAVFPAVSYTITAATSAEGSDCNFTDINVPVNIAVGPSADATVNFSVNGGSTTAADGFDFQLMTSNLVFPAGATSTQDMVLRIFHDNFDEIDETVTIDFTVDANGGDAQASSNTYTYTIVNDDISSPSPTQIVTILNSDFEANDTTSWTTLANDTDGNDWLCCYSGPVYTGVTGNFALSESHGTHLGTGQNYKPDNFYHTTIGVNIPVTATNINFSYGLAGFDDSEPFEVYWTTDVSTVGSITGGTLLDSGTTQTDAGELISINISDSAIIATMAAQPIYLAFRHKSTGNGPSGTGGLLILDNVKIDATVPSFIQTDVNTAVSNDQANIKGLGSVYTNDSVSGDVMLDITNNDNFDYGCTDISVSRSGISAQSYNGSASPDLVMDKVFTITPNNTTTTGDTSIKFYFESSEITGWETATSLSRSNLVAYKESTGDIVNLTVDTFGSHIILSGDFTGLDGDFYFGTTATFAKISLAPKVYLQGAALNPNSGEETLMRDDLRVGNYIPTTSPYADAATCNATVFNTTGANAIVDWIWVELRDETTNTTVVHSQSALLQRDGDVVGVDGISALSFESVARNYYISINHRNHLGVMTANPVALSSTATVVDFTNMTGTDLYDVSGGINYDGTEQITVGAVKTLIAGDASGDGKVGYNNAASDINTIQLETLLHPDNTTFNAGFSSGFGYYNSDINMDGKVVYSASGSDLNQLQLFVLLYPLNTTYNTGYDFIQEQLPQ